MKALNDLKDLIWEPEDDDVCTADGGIMVVACDNELDPEGGGPDTGGVEHTYCPTIIFFFC